MADNVIPLTKYEEEKRFMKVVHLKKIYIEKLFARLSSLALVYVCQLYSKTIFQCLQTPFVHVYGILL